MKTKWVLVDTESGAIPGSSEGSGDRRRGKSPFSGVMTEFGAVELVSKASFHGVLWPSRPSLENPAVPEILPDARPFDKKKVMTDFVEWLGRLETDRLVFVSDNPAWDWMWIAFAFDEAGIENPFGYSARRIGDFWAGLRNNWRDASSWKRYRITDHTHDPVMDSQGNAEALQYLLEEAGQWQKIVQG